MSAQIFPQGYGRTLIKKNAHSCNFQGSRGVFQDRSGLLYRNAWKPFQELGKLCPILKVFEECSHRDPGTTEYPSATYALWVAFNGWAGRPVNHV